jgi:hypothetical protein
MVYNPFQVNKFRDVSLMGELFHFGYEAYPPGRRIDGEVDFEQNRTDRSVRFEKASQP